MDIEFTTTGLVHILNSLSDEKQKRLLSSIDKFIGFYKSFKSGVEAAKFFNQLASDFQEKQLSNDPEKAKRVFCSKGCSKCCYYPVAVTKDEAELILFHCYQNRIEINTSRLEIQRSTERELWYELPIGDRACIFLDEADGSCRIHDVRPNSCRNHLALDTDEFCGEQNHPQQQSYGIVLAHASTTAAFNCSKPGIFADYLK